MFPTNIQQARLAQILFNQINKILQLIFSDPTVKLVWPSTIDATSFVIMKGENAIARGLDGLSFGQATLFSIFVTLLRYQSMGASLAPNCTDVVGICIVDEIDAHLHTNLQNRVLPELIAMFPRIQFIMSSHSPLFALGMADKFGSDGVQVFDVQKAQTINVEAYREFRAALDVLMNTQGFDDEVKKQVANLAKPTIFLEGETDPIYLKAAIDLLGFSKVQSHFDVDWIGAKAKESGQGINTGKSAMTKALQFLEANERFVSRAVVLVVDNDHSLRKAESEKVFVRQVPMVDKNKYVKKGIEALLPNACFNTKFFSTKKVTKDNGTIITTKELDKMRLCKNVCENRKKASDFEAFRPLLEELDTLLVTLEA